MRVRSLFLVALVLTGCEADPSPDARPADPAPAVSPAPVTASPKPAAVDSVHLALGAEGLRFVDAETGLTRLLAFGGTRATVVPALARVRGDAYEAAVNTECGAGPLGHVTWGDGLTALFAGDAFVGWSVDGRRAGAERYTTMAGMGTGSTRAEAEAAVTLTAEETTLGTEFSAGGISGLLSGPGADAAVTHLWAGTSCNFR